MRPDAARALVAHLGQRWRQDVQTHSGVNLDHVEARGFRREWHQNGPEMGNAINGNDPGRVLIDELRDLLASAKQLRLVLDPDLIAAVERETPAP